MLGKSVEGEKLPFEVASSNGEFDYQRLDKKSLLLSRTYNKVEAACSSFRHIGEQPVHSGDTNVIQWAAEHVTSIFSYLLVS